MSKFRTLSAASVMITCRCKLYRPIHLHLPYYVIIHEGLKKFR